MQMGKCADEQFKKSAHLHIPAFAHQKNPYFRTNKIFKKWKIKTRTTLIKM